MNEGASRCCFCCCRSREAEEAAATAIERRASTMAFEKKRWEDPRFPRQPSAEVLANAFCCSRHARMVTATRLLGEETRSLRMASARGADIGAKAEGKEPPRSFRPRARLASLALAPLPPLLLPAAAAAADAGLEEALIVSFDREKEGREREREKRGKARVREGELLLWKKKKIVMRFLQKKLKKKKTLLFYRLPSLSAGKHAPSSVPSFSPTRSLTAYLR